MSTYLSPSSSFDVVVSFSSSVVVLMVMVTVMVLLMDVVVFHISCAAKGAVDNVLTHSKADDPLGSMRK